MQSAVNVTLPAFAAERRAAAPLLHAWRPAAAAVYRSPAGTALSSKPAASCVQRANDGTDRRTDGHCPVSQTPLRILCAYSVTDYTEAMALFLGAIVV